jgi:hypothetical protein
LLLGAALVAAGVVGAVVIVDPFGGSDSPQPRRVQAAAPTPADGTVLRVAESSSVYVVKAGARFRVPPGERAVFGYVPEEADEISAAALRDIPEIPREGSLVKPYRSTVVWVVRDGQRRLIGPPAGADLVTIPSTGLRQIPPPAAGRRTTVAVTAPVSVLERRAFSLAALVRSPKGVPTGACVFFRIDRSRLRERANTPTKQGRCEARLRVGGLSRVRYSVHFVGDPGWRGSKSASPPILVVPR